MVSSDERRKAARLSAEVKVDYRTLGSFITDWSRDISQGGIFIRTSLPLSIGDTIRLRVTLPGRDLPFALEGVVRWVNSTHTDDGTPPGMGVEFTNLDDQLKSEIAEFVKTLESDGS